MNCFSQSIRGVVRSPNGAAIPFASIKYDGNKGAVADLHGRFALDSLAAFSTSFLDITGVGYAQSRVPLPLKDSIIVLLPANTTLEEVVIVPQYDKIKRIINLAIANRSSNNPDKYHWYQCRVYYKMLFDVAVPDSVKTDTAKDIREMTAFFDRQHLLMSETISKRTWQQPSRLQEDVLGSRFSGFKKSFFTGLVTDVLPFHSYTNYLTLNGVDYHNPVSNGFWAKYKFNLVDELLTGSDTLWIISFRPKTANANAIKGSVYISSSGYAITNLVANNADTVLKRRVRIEQQYRKVVDDTIARWFPSQLNYTIEMDQQVDKKFMVTYIMNGYSNIDSVSFIKKQPFRFDNAHTTRLTPGADELPDTSWKKARPVAISLKESNTYHFMDSIGDRYHFDKNLVYFSKLSEGLLPVGPVDIDLTRILLFNKVENLRLGMGLQTNEKLSKWFTIGGSVGYGFRDKSWKYGGFVETRLGQQKEFRVNASYDNDIYDPGRLRIHPDIDKLYLGYYLLQRVDRVESYSLTLKNKFGYLDAALKFTQQLITPQYDYTLFYEGARYQSFLANEASLSLRYAFGERTAPMLGSYYATGSKYPVLYAKIISGDLAMGDVHTSYTQLLGAVTINKHINRLGRERLQVKAGISFNDKVLPLSKLFAGPGYKFGEEKLNNVGLFAFGGLLTMYPYGYYSDQFVNLCYRHDFDWKLYKYHLSGTPWSSAPSFGMQYGMLYGTLSKRAAQGIDRLMVADNAYHEAGLLVNNLIRLKYLNVYYLTICTGYFIHIKDNFNADRDSRIVAGLDVEF